MAQFTFTPEQRKTFRDELSRVMFIQEGMKTAAGVTPTHGPVRVMAANGVSNQMLTFLENMIRESERARASTS